MGPDGNKIGEYRLDPATNKVTYTPTDVNYVGAVPPAEIGALDKNGTLAVTTYTPNITPTYPTAEEATSVDVQGAVQKGTVEFKAGSDVVLIDKTKTTLLDENNQPAEKVPAKSPEGKVIGEYTLNKETGEVTFTPDPKVPYAGDVVPAKVQAQNTAGRTVETTYTPSIIPVNPSANPATSEGPQGVEQTGTVEFIPGNPQKAPETPAPIDKSTIKLLDKSGNEVETVTVTDKDGKEIGVYSLVKDPTGTPTGEVKFTPTEKTYVGKVEPVTVQAKDKNSTVAKTTYTPNFTGVTPTGEVSETEGARGAVQKSPVVFDTPDQDNTTVNFNKGDEKVALDKSTLTLVDKAGKEVKEVTVPGEGTYVLKDGVVEFTPEKDFTGKASGVTVQVKDVNGKPVSKTYTPTVRPVTEFVDKNGNPITVDKDNKSVESKVDGKADKKDIPGYKFVETKVDEKGNTKHIYEKVTTSFKDKDGNEIPNHPTEEGTVDKKEIPGYRFVETKKLPNGDVEHIYEKVEKPTPSPVTPTPTSSVRKVITTYTTVDGEFISPKEDGEQPSKELSGYELVKTEKDENGNVRHVYRKVTTPTPETSIITTFIDENDNPIVPNENGEVPAKDIPEYELVRTEKDANGNVRHIYRKVATPTPAPQEKVARQELPNTGTGNEFAIFGAAATAILSGLGLASPTKKKED